MEPGQEDNLSGYILYDLIHMSSLGIWCLILRAPSPLVSDTGSQFGILVFWSLPHEDYSAFLKCILSFLQVDYNAVDQVFGLVMVSVSISYALIQSANLSDIIFSPPLCYCPTFFFSIIIPIILYFLGFKEIKRQGKMSCLFYLRFVELLGYINV